MSTVAIKFLRNIWNENKSKITFNLIIKCFYHSPFLKKIKVKKQLISSKNHTVIDSIPPFSGYVERSQNQSIRPKIPKRRKRESSMIYYL